MYYLQNGNKDTGMENKCMDTNGGEEGWEEMKNWDWHKYTVDTMYKKDS